MGIFELIIVSIGLSMDSFAVSMCKGMAMNKFKLKKAIIIGLYFAIFHIIMTYAGYYFGSVYERSITDIDHWIAFGLLLMVGGSMIKDALSKDNNKYTNRFNSKTMIPLALSTSVDSLAVGISFAFFKVNIYIAAFVFAISVFAISILGSKIGTIYGDKYEHKAQIAGGIILILVGVKILLEHLGVF